MYVLAGRMEVVGERVWGFAGGGGGGSSVNYLCGQTVNLSAINACLV